MTNAIPSIPASTSVPASHPLRPLLKNWLWERGHVGTRYIDLASRELKFDEGKKALNPLPALWR
jgi:hypothetical protein